LLLNISVTSYSGSYYRSDPIVAKIEEKIIPRYSKKIDPLTYYAYVDVTHMLVDKPITKNKNNDK
jgi:hypothetical protein